MANGLALLINKKEEDKDKEEDKKEESIDALVAFEQQLMSEYKDFISESKKKVGEGAKVDRMVKHIEKSEKKLGKSKKEAENIAWATANKRGFLDNKNKKK